MHRPVPHAVAFALALSLVAVPAARAQGADRSPGAFATSTIMWRLDSACTSGALAACDTIGMHHWATRKKDQRRRAVAVWDSACTAGGIGACANLAMAYDDGEGVKRDRRRAATLARQACDAGSGPGCVAIASMLSDGRAGQKDVAGGAALMEQACTTMKDLIACLNMAYRALDGSFGVARDTTRARAFAAEACAAAKPDHPYPWYRESGDDACALSHELGPAPPH
jgi:TPR repeat protein